MVKIIHMSKNFVNLGKFYSIPPWGLPISYNSVNLGGFYAEAQHPQPTGWGYFEDGSVYINAKTYLEHNAFEAEMKLLWPFVHGPSPNLARERERNLTKRRLVVLAKARPSQTDLSVMARNIRDKERIAVRGTPFENIRFSLNEAGTRLVSAEVDQERWRPSLKHREELVRALHTFRGTLVDGVLQPNVRLNNSLALSTKSRFSRTTTQESENDSEGIDLDFPSHDNNVSTRRTRSRRPHGESAEYARRTTFPPDRKDRVIEDSLSRRQAELNKREQQLLLLQQQLLSQSMRSLARRRKDLRLRRRRMNNTDYDAANFEVEERELLQEEEILSQIRRNLVRQQKLAKAQASYVPQQQDQEDELSIEAEMSPSTCEEASESPTSKSRVDDPYAGFDLENPTPPKSLANIRSRTRIMLPRKYP